MAMKPCCVMRPEVVDEAKAKEFNPRDRSAVSSVPEDGWASSERVAIDPIPAG